MGKGLISSFRRMLWKQLFMSLFVFIIAMLFHSWLIVYVNNGFMLTAVKVDRIYRPYMDLVNVPGNVMTAAFFWPFWG